MENDFIKYIWGGFVTLILPFMALFTKRAMEGLDEAKRKGEQNELNLEKFKTHVADIYAKEATTQSSLARIHDRMDKGFGDIEKDIKTLIAKVK